MSDFFSTENLKDVCQKNPDSILFAHLAARYIEEDEYQKSIDLCSKGLEKHPDYAFGHFILGLAHYHVKNYTDAKKELETALAYDPANPKAWEVLSTINEILNLSDDANKSNLHSYLVDYFNKEASPNFIPKEESPALDVEEDVVEEKTQIKDQVEEIPSEITESDIENVVEDVLADSDDEFDFEKTLNEVFKEDEPSIRTEKGESELTDKEIESVEQKSEDSVDTGKKEMVSADEFTSAIASFFTEDEEKTESDETTEGAGEESTEKKEADEEKSIGESILESEATEDQPQEEQKEMEKIEPEIEIPTEKSDDELMDISSVVSDFMEDTDILPEEKADQQAGIDESKLEETAPPPSDLAESEPPAIEKELEVPKESDFTMPEIPKDDVQQEIKPEKKTDLEAFRLKKSSREKDKQIGKPPILSPTLGEIYIAQGRFEEAIDVFKQLIGKDPQNARYKRKIADLEKIIAKRESSG